MAKSLYKNTSKDENYLYYYNPINIDYDDTDVYITVDEKYNNKPGLLAYDLYGDESLMWVFRYFNSDKMNDLIFDLKSGMSLRVPTKNRIESYF